MDPIDIRLTAPEKRFDLERVPSWANIRVGFSQVEFRFARLARRMPESRPVNLMSLDSDLALLKRKAL